MDPNFWQQYAVGGATRPDSFTGMNPEFNSALQQLFMAAPPEIQSNLRVMSGYRSPERQAQLWQNALRKYGSPERARKWVAPPGNSQHNHGFASDLKYGNDAARQWAHENASRFGLHFPLSNENWHVELMGARDGHPVEVAKPVAQPQQVVQRQAVIQQPMAADQQQAVVPQPTPGQNLASMYMQAPAAPLAGPANVNPLAVADATPAGLGLLFAQQQMAQREKRKEEQEAEALRKAALFGANPYG